MLRPPPMCDCSRLPSACSSEGACHAPSHDESRRKFCELLLVCLRGVHKLLSSSNAACTRSSAYFEPAVIVPFAYVQVRVGAANLSANLSVQRTDSGNWHEGK